MSKHTPKPWILAAVPTSVGSCHKIGPFPNGDRVSTFACVYADGHRLDIDDANSAAIELAANARLIAASPDLLALLIELRHTLWPTYRLSPEGRDYIAKMDAAITKATGKQP